MTDPVPRIIHQLWKTADVPEQFKKSTQAWRDLHPEYRYILWTDESMRAHVQAKHPDLLQKYDAFEYNIQRADFFRPIILKDFGGIYSDLDLYPQKSLEPYLAECDRSPTRVFLVDSPVVGSAINSFMISKPGSPFWDLVLSLTRTSAPWYALTKHLKVMTTTGPIVLQQAVNLSREPITFLPKSLFNAYGMGEDCNVQKPDVVMRCTNTESTWASADTWFWTLFWRYPQTFSVLALLFLVAVVAAITYFAKSCPPCRRLSSRK